MKKLLIILTLLVSSGLAGIAPPLSECLLVFTPPPINPYMGLWYATIKTESDGDPLAYNPEEQATGISQIRPIRLQDYNLRTGHSYVLSDMYSPTISRKVFMYYASKYKPNDLETISRAWNGSGEKTKVYWKKVKRNLRNVFYGI